MRRALTVVAALTVAALAGCGGGAKPAGVASLAGSNSPATTTKAAGKQNVAQLYHLWAECMRQHGVQMADPVINIQGQVNVSIPGADQSTFEAANQACDAQHKAAQSASRGGQPPEKPDPTKLLKYSTCMRAHGLADFPDPSGNGLRISVHPGSDLSPDNPTFQKAQKACQALMGSMKGGERMQMSGGPGGGAVKGG